MPEIREQAYDVARAVVRALHGETRRRPTDAYGLTLTTGQAAAEAYNEALGRLLRLQDGVEDGLAARGRDRPRLRPGPGRARPARARVGRDRLVARVARRRPRGCGRPPPRRPRGQLPRRRHDPAAPDEATGAAALLRHIRLFPRDALAVSVAVPTVAFGGLTSGRQTAELVEGLGRTYGDDWWYAGQLAFVRQDQERWTEAEDLSSYALAVEPASGHAATPAPTSSTRPASTPPGLAWLDEWIRTAGRRPTTAPTSPGTRPSTS